MSYKVYKYAIPSADRFTLDLPFEAQILHVGTQPVGTQGARPYLWALVNPTAPVGPVHFLLRGTGHDIETVGDLTYRGTFTLHYDALVFHLFEVTG